MSDEHYPEFTSAQTERLDEIDNAVYHRRISSGAFSPTAGTCNGGEHHYMFGSEMVPAGLFAVLICFVPETPRYLAMVGHGEATPSVTPEDESSDPTEEPTGEPEETPLASPNMSPSVSPVPSIEPLVQEDELPYKGDVYEQPEGDFSLYISQFSSISGPSATS